MLDGPIEHSESADPDNNQDDMIRAVRDFEAEMEAASDHLSLVIKAYYAIEKKVESALLNALPAPDRLELRRISFLLKIDILIALGFLPQPLRPLFDRINSIRNIYAHDPHKVLSEGDFSNLKSVLKAHVPNIQKIEVPNAIGSLKTLFTVTFLHSYMAMERTAKHKAGNYVNSLYIEEVRRDKQVRVDHKTLTDIDAEIEFKLKDYVAKNFPEFDTESFIRDLLPSRITPNKQKEGEAF
jgi:hypothetical protein